ncbi:MAG: preprotein translocase subunit SecG [Rikenellaceae bacterium]
MYIFLIVLIFIASALLVLSVLAQNPKSGMAANFGASNAVMGVRQTASFLERFTWGLAVSIVVLSLAATMAMPSGDISRSKEATQLEQMIGGSSEGSNAFGAPAVTNEAATASDIVIDSTIQ